MAVRRRLGRAPYAKCPECYRGHGLKRQGRPDPVDRMSKSWLSRIGGMFGAPLYWCSFCRLQFHDVRPWDEADRSYKGTAMSAGG